MQHELTSSILPFSFGRFKSFQIIHGHYNSCLGIGLIFLYHFFFVFTCSFSLSSPADLLTLGFPLYKELHFEAWIVLVYLMERSLRYTKVWGQRICWPASKLIVKRCSKPRPAHRKPGCCSKEKTERQHLSLKTEKIWSSQGRVFREYKLLNNKKLLGIQVLFLSLNFTESMDLRWKRKS